MYTLHIHMSVLYVYESKRVTLLPQCLVMLFFFVGNFYWKLINNERNCSQQETKKRYF